MAVHRRAASGGMRAAWIDPVMPSENPIRAPGGASRSPVDRVGVFIAVRMVAREQALSPPTPQPPQEHPVDAVAHANPRMRHAALEHGDWLSEREVLKRERRA